MGSVDKWGQCKIYNLLYFFTSIRFDHGVGCWSIDGKATAHWIDVNAVKGQQVVRCSLCLRG